MIVEDKLKSITIPQIGYIRQAIIQALDNIYTKRTILKQIIKNNPSLDRGCKEDNLITKSYYSCSRHEMR